MTLSPMRYKSYTWPHNPRVYSIDYQRKMAVHKTPFGLYQLQDLGRTNRVMEGEGEFVGAGAYEEFQRLACVFYEVGPGLLVHPLWQVANTYFAALRLEQILSSRLEQLMEAGHGEVLQTDFVASEAGGRLTVTLLAECREEIGRTVERDGSVGRIYGTPQGDAGAGG